MLRMRESLQHEQQQQQQQQCSAKCLLSMMAVPAGNHSIISLNIPSLPFYHIGFCQLCAMQVRFACDLRRMQGSPQQPLLLRRQQQEQ
jgi:hypothetical protein